PVAGGGGVRARPRPQAASAALGGTGGARIPPPPSRLHLLYGRRLGREAHPVAVVALPAVDQSLRFGNLEKLLRLRVGEVVFGGKKDLIAQLRGASHERPPEATRRPRLRFDLCRLLCMCSPPRMLPPQRRRIERFINIPD